MKADLVDLSAEARSVMRPALDCTCRTVALWSRKPPLSWIDAEMEDRINTRWSWNLPERKNSKESKVGEQIYNYCSLERQYST